MEGLEKRLEEMKVVEEVNRNEDAAKAFKPKVLYPYHFGNTNTSDLEALMKDTPEVEVRVRNMK